MICAELQAKESINNSIPDTVRALGKKGIIDVCFPEYKHECMILLGS